MIDETRALAEHDVDDALVALWLHGRPETTQVAYRRDIEAFRRSVQKPLAHVLLQDLQAYADELADKAPATRARALSAVKSLLAFGARLQVLPVNVGAAIKLPAVRNRLAERVLDQLLVQRMIVEEPNHRNQLLLTIIYVTGIRVSEACALTWRDLQERLDGGQVTVFGKGGKTRAIRIPAGLWREVLALRGSAELDAPIFSSRRGGPLDRSTVLRIVRRAAARAGLEGVSPHWLRHSHATAALDRGCPLHVLRDTLGHSSLATTSRYVHARPGASSSTYVWL